MNLTRHVQNIRLLSSLIGGCRKRQAIEKYTLQNILVSLWALPSCVGFLPTGGQMLQHAQASSQSRPLPEGEERQSLLGAYHDQQGRPFPKAPAHLSPHPFGQNWVTCPLCTDFWRELQDKTSQGDWRVEWG